MTQALEEKIKELQHEKEGFRKIGLDWMEVAKETQKKLDEALAKLETVNEAAPKLPTENAEVEHGV